MLINWEELEGVKPNMLSISKQIEGKNRLSPTRTEMTERAYFDFVKSSLKNISRYNNLESTNEITCEDIQRWVGSIRITYRASSWRFARASFSNLLERALTQLAQTLTNTIDLIQADKITNEIVIIEETLIEIKKLKWAMASTNIGKTAAQRSKELPAKSSSAKKKFVNAELLFRLDQYISLTGSEWQRRSMKMCWAIMYTGLRPCEWEQATIEEEGKNLILTIVNAKNTNGRACGDTRQLKVTEGNAQKVVREQIESVIQWKKYSETSKAGNDFRKVYVAQCANALRIAQIQYFGESKEITPYSFRHQFSANLKSAGFSKLEVAQSMGHASLKTAGQHYGKRRMGYSSIASRRGDAMAAKMPTDFAEKIMVPSITVITKQKMSAHPSQSTEVKIDLASPGVN